jgi:ATP-binding cassette, subfamily B, bacterial
MKSPSVAPMVRITRDPGRDVDRRPLSTALLRRMWGLLGSQSERRNWLLVLVVIRAIQLPLFAWAIGAVINGPIANHRSFGTILWAAIGILVLAAWTQWTLVYRQRLALELGERVVYELRRQVFNKLQEMPISHFSKTKTGRIISRITSDCEAVRVGVQDVLFVSLVQVGQMFGAGLLMAWYDLALFGCVLVMAPIVALIVKVMRHRLWLAYREVQDSFARVTATIAESVAIIRVTQAMAREDLNAQSFNELNADHAHYNMNISRISGIMMPMLEWTGQISMALIILVGGYRAILDNNPMPVGDLIQFWFLAGLFFSPIQILGGQYDAALSAMAGAERVFGVLDSQPQWSDIENPIDFSPSSKVTFGYEPDRPVLHQIDLTIEPGTMVALVGQTGSGKSTLANLIARFYLPQSGEIRIDGVHLRDMSAASVARHIAVVHQQNFLFTGTVRENMIAGRDGIGDDQIWNAFDRLGCRSILEELSDGLDTQVGSKGGRLSLGQKQLLCFARALIGDPKVIILDEATSAVDTITELKIQRAMNRLLQGRTAIVIAHRLSTIRMAEKIVVLSEGRIVEMGTHDDLVRLGGHYAELERRFTMSKPTN